MNYLKGNFNHFLYFYHFLGYRLFLTIVISFVVGILDGVGLAMFLPLLSVVIGENEMVGDELGGFEFILEDLESLGFSLNLVNLLLVIVFFFTLKGIAVFCKKYYSVIVRLYLVRELRIANIDYFSNYAYKNFVKADAGRIQNTLTSEVARISQASTSYLDAVHGWIMLLVYVSFAFITNWQFTVLVGIGGVISNLLYRKVYKHTKAESLKISKGGNIYQRLLLQSVTFFKYLRATGLFKSYGEKLKQSIIYIENSKKKIGYYNSILNASREPLIILVVCAVLFIQFHYLEDSSGVLYSFMLFYRALNYVLSIQTSWNVYLNNSGALINMEDFVNDLKSNQVELGSVQFEGLKESIRIEDAYLSFGDVNVLNGIDLVIEKNRTIALVGESGSGKTTLVNSVCALIPLNGGQIKIDGVNMEEFNSNTIQSKVGYITQDPVIFSDTIYNNVTCWSPKTQENISKFWNVLKQAALDEFIRNLSEQEESQLGNNGIQLSGGQKQRVSIARELFKNIEILIMDEATSALDSETEKAIQENIDALKGQYTIIIVAHRLSTIRKADQIFVLSKGKIKTNGTYSELIENSEEFNKMIKLQKL